MTHARCAAAFLAAILIAPAALGQQDETVSPAYGALMACRAVEPESARIECLDRELAAFAEAVESGQIVVIEREAVRALERESFGIAMPGVQRLTGLLRRGGAESEGPQTEILQDGSQVVYRADGAVEEMRSLPVRNVTYDRTGRAIVTLANGQVWVQSDSTQFAQVNRRRLEEGLTADLYPGALGSYFMALSHHPRRFRARRSE